MTFWIVLLIILALFWGDFIDTLLGVVAVLAYIFLVLYGPLIFTTIDISQEGPLSEKTSPREELYTNVIFADSSVTEIPGEVICPYIKANECPLIPAFISWINTDVTYTIDVQYADVKYSPFYTKETNGTYRWMTTTLDEGSRNTTPIEYISDFYDFTTVDVILNAKWKRCFYERERTVVLKSIVCIVPRDEDMTYGQWQLSCDEKLDSLNVQGEIAITYMSGSVETPVYRMLDSKTKAKDVSSENLSYATKDLPKVERAIDLRQDLYKTSRCSPVNVTDVEVSSVVDGGLLAEISFEPVEETLLTTLLFQYYTDAEDTKDAYKTDYAYVAISPGQNKLQLLIEEAYDQFALVGFIEEPIFDLAVNNSERLTLMANVQFSNENEVSDHATLCVHKRGSYSYLLVDHREGFWQKVFYSKYTNDFDWMTTILISIPVLGLLVLAVWFLIKKFKKE